MLLAVTAAMNFGFYGFRAFLAPYIAQTFYSGLDAAAAQAHADLLASGLLALMYATPIVGGYLADKVLGEALSLLLSLWLSVLGLVLMALPTLFGFEIGMAALALSSGLNVTLSVMIGRDYATSDPRREGGYTLFYLAVNAGSFVAPFVCADWIGGRFGYRMGFIAAAVGMALAALVMQLRHHKLRPLLPHVDESEFPGSSRGAGGNRHPARTDGAPAVPARDPEHGDVCADGSARTVFHRELHPTSRSNRRTRCTS